MLLNHSFKITDYPGGDNAKPTSLTEWTYRYLKEQILNLEIAPGEQIHINEFAEKLEISRTPIREAFLRLIADGLIEVRPRVGYFVTEITEQDIRDIFEIREIFETRATTKAIGKIPDFELETIKKLISQCKREVVGGNLQYFVDVDIRFHAFILDQFQNKLLSEFMQSMNDLTYRIRVVSLQSLENIHLSINEHEKILNSLIERDSKQAEYNIVEHLANACERMVNIFKEVSRKKPI